MLEADDQENGSLSLREGVNDQKNRLLDVETSKF
jgi:hypothetical protein